MALRAHPFSQDPSSPDGRRTSRQFNFNLSRAQLFAIPAGLALVAISFGPSSHSVSTLDILSSAVEGPAAAGAPDATSLSLSQSQPLISLPDTAQPGLIPPSLLNNGPMLPLVGPALVAPVPQAVIAPADAPAPMTHLPEWVQTTDAANFWSGPDQHAVRFNTLPPWTFLHVTGVQADRLSVEFAGDATHQAGPGWVSVSVVQPSDASGTWLSNPRAATLFNGPTANAGVALNLGKGATMRVLDTAQQGRIPVRVYTTDLSRVAADGWVNSQDVTQSAPPKQAVNTQRTSAPASPYRGQQDFINSVATAARTVQAQTGVPASVTIAQAILESDWGQSLLTREANNYFGIKAMGHLGSDGAVWMKTMEYADDGSSYYINAPFRAYQDLADSVADHANLFTSLPRYHSAMLVARNPNAFAQQINDDGYSTDPAYPSKLIALMNKYNLYSYDS